MLRSPDPARHNSATSWTSTSPRSGCCSTAPTRVAIAPSVKGPSDWKNRLSVIGTLAPDFDANSYWRERKPGDQRTPRILRPIRNHFHNEVTVRRIQQRLFAKVFRSQRKPVQISKSFQHLTQ